MTLLWNFLQGFLQVLLQNCLGFFKTFSQGFFKKFFRWFFRNFCEDSVSNFSKSYSKYSLWFSKEFFKKFCKRVSSSPKYSLALWSRIVSPQQPQPHSPQTCLLCSVSSPVSYWSLRLQRVKNSLQKKKTFSGGSVKHSSIFFMCRISFRNVVHQSLQK